MANKLKKHLNDKQAYLINPRESLKRGLGILKNHKPGIPLRHIVSSFNSIVKKCKHSLNSTQDLKRKILKIPKFDNNEFEVVSFDCVSLYTYVDLNLVINKKMSVIYENEDNFFPKGTRTITINNKQITKETKPPSIFLLKQLFNAVCTDFNSFQTLNGFYCQIQGCSMGSKLSPSLENMFAIYSNTK